MLLHYNHETKYLKSIIELNNDLTDSALLIRINEIYTNISHKSDAYLCITDSLGNLIFHSILPEKTGNFVGDNLLLENNETIGRLSDINEGRQIFTGDYISSTGENQIASFNFVASRSWIIGLHHPEVSFRNEISSTFSWIIYAFFILPRSLYFIL